MTTPDAIIKIRLAKDNAERVTFLCQDAGCSIDWSNEFQKSITDGLDVAVSFAEQNTKLQYESEAIVKYFDDLFHALELLMINKTDRLLEVLEETSPGHASIEVLRQARQNAIDRPAFTLA